jgi:hypothetical protein
MSEAPGAAHRAPVKAIRLVKDSEMEERPLQLRRQRGEPWLEDVTQLVCGISRQMVPSVLGVEHGRQHGRDVSECPRFENAVASRERKGVARSPVLEQDERSMEIPIRGAQSSLSQSGNCAPSPARIQLPTSKSANPERRVQE